MGSGDIVFYVVALTALLQGVSCVCLLSRMEHYPCTYRKPNTTDKPGNNEAGKYMTRYRGDKCGILRRRHRVDALPSISIGGSTIFYLYSPGISYPIPQYYANQCLMLANVNCTSGQFIYFELLYMNLENRKCYDHGTGTDKCVDYLWVRTPSGLVSDNCGTDTSNLNGVILPFDSIQVVFRSDHRIRYPGFIATATCFSPTPKPRNCVSQRRTSERRPVPVNQCQASTHDEIRIPYGHNLTFNGHASYSTLNVVNRNTNAVTNRYFKSTITTLKFISMNGSTQTFQNHYTKVPIGPRGPQGPRGYSLHVSQYAQSIPSILPGPGIFYAPRKGVSKQACFQNYLVDVSKYVPTEEEKRIIKSQNQALEVTIPREEPLPDDEDLDYDFDPELITTGTVSIVKPTKTPIYIKPDFNNPQRLQFRQKRAASSSRKQTDLIDQAALLSAVSNDKDCNVILRGSSERLVALLTRENPVKLASLRQQARSQRS